MHTKLKTNKQSNKQTNKVNQTFQSSYLIDMMQKRLLSQVVNIPSRLRHVFALFDQRLELAMEGGCPVAMQLYATMRVERKARAGHRGVDVGAIEHLHRHLRVNEKQ
jgi:hypothetical protein